MTGLTGNIMKHIIYVAIVYSDGSILHAQLRVHTDAVWGLSVQGSKMLSCSADGTVKLWSIDNSIIVLQTFKVDTGWLLACHLYGSTSSLNFHVYLFSPLACSSLLI